MNLVTSMATARTPSCLSSFRAARLGGNDNDVCYAIACPCGSEIGRITSEFDAAERFWADPLVFECTACGSSAVFFDSRKHGYDAVLNGFSAYSARTRDEPVPCESCGADRHKLTASFGYGFEDEEVEQDWSEEDRGNMPDLFDSAAFELTCARCGHRQGLSRFECA